ncbi:MAG TPA: hypothetical protein VJ930_08560 [Acidimicrobiia bacterium]|jgi:hypothetical protein|nr:hypothetical protein [Acidimicrobiia bacterium]
MTDSGRSFLAIYLRDHRAGAVAGRRLAQRLAKQNPYPQWAPLRGVAREIQADEATLVDLLEHFGIAEGVLKNMAAAAMETVERLKPNGRPFRYSPLSLVLELESLMSGVTAKRRLWVSLEKLNRPTPAGIDFEELDRRAVDQLNTLAALHDTAARLAFLDDQAHSGDTKRSSVHLRDTGAV